MNMPELRPELRDYLMAGAPKSLLLIGDRHSKAKEDAVKVASFLLGSEFLDGLQDYLLIEPEEGAKSLGVDDADRIIAKAQTAPYSAEKQVILVDGIDLMTVPAQNKLLKLLEESVTVVVVAVAYKDTMLPTIKSRMQVVRYVPLSMAQFKSYCDENAVGDPLALYFMTGGSVSDIALAKEQAEVFETFVKVSEICKEGTSGIPEVMGTLHMVKEKDPKSFFENHSEYASKMLSLVTYQVVQAEGIDPVTERMLDTYNKDVLRMSGVSYTKDDFMNFFVQTIEGG